MHFFCTSLRNAEGGLQNSKSLLIVISYVNAANDMLPSLRRRMHPGALFLCAQAGCGKRFKTRNAVELHRSTVGHGEAPFQIIGSSPPDKGWMIHELRPQ